MKKKLVYWSLLSLLFSFDIYAMEIPKPEPKKRKIFEQVVQPEEEITLQESEQERKEEIEQKEAKPPVKVAKFLSGLEELAPEIKAQIVKTLTVGEGPNELNRLISAVQNIRALGTSSPEFAFLLYDPKTTDYLIKELSERYTGNNRVRAAIALGTSAASEWVASNRKETSIEDDILSELDKACRENHADEVKFLVQYLPYNDPLINKPYEDSIPIISATHEGNEKIVDLLVRKGANVNAQTVDLHTPLIIAVNNEDKHLVKYFIEHKADSNSKSSIIGWTALMYAILLESLAIFDELLTAQDIQVDVKNNDGATALIIAASRGQYEMVKRLIAKNANLDISDTNGTTALMFAITNRHTNVARELIDKGANINLRRNDGVSAFMIAVDFNNLELVDLLLQKGAEINGKGPLGMTALIEAAMTGKEAIVQRLLGARADVNSKDNAGMTALMYAIQNQYPAIVELLLDEKGINANLQDSQGHSAFWYAQQLPDGTDKKEILEVFQEHCITQ